MSKWDSDAVHAALDPCGYVIKQKDKEIERLRKNQITGEVIGRVADLHAEIRELKAENEQMRQALRDVYEVWAGSDGFIPETASEAYQQRLILKMRDYASTVLRGEV